MIPVRVALDGFMSYRERAELVFEGAALWVLAGRNGSGKSAIFDAITYALYGVHRGGTQNAKALINHSAKTMSVEFDFAIGDETFRVKRTLGRRSTSTVQAFRMDGGSPVPIAETETKVGFDRWIASTIGLDVRTFTASVLLLQGRSEALLDADPKTRHEMLGQVIDLSAYERLFERAEEIHKGSHAIAAHARSQLELLPEFDPADAEALSARVSEATLASERARGEVERLIELKAEARRWAELAVERARLETEIADAAELMGRAESIERNAARFREVQDVIPVLARLLDERGRRAAKQRELTECEADVSRESATHDAVSSARNAERETVEALSGRRAQMEELRSRAVTETEKLAPHRAELERLARARQCVAEAERVVGEMPGDLEEQARRLEAECESLLELRNVLPVLRMIAAAREAERRAVSAESTASTRLASLDEDLARAREHETSARAALDDASSAIVELERRTTETGTLLAEARRHFERFATVGGGATCSYCGQKLTKAHVATERKRLDDEIQAREREAAAAASALSDASVGRDALDASVREYSSAATRVADARNEAARALALALEARDREARRGRETIDELPPTFADRARDGGYPTAEDVALASSASTALDAARRRRSEVETLLRDRDAVLARHANHRAEESELSKTYPAEREAEILAAIAGHPDEVSSAKASLASIDVPLGDAARRLRECERSVAEATTRLSDAENRRSAARATLDEVERNLAHTEQSVPPSWRERGDAHELARLRVEASALEDSVRDHERLVEARAHHRARADRLAELVAVAERISVPARRPIEVVDGEERRAREALSEADRFRAEAQSRLRDLEGLRTRREEAEQTATKSTHTALVYRELAKLLGRDRLQRHLLLHAETAITALANEVLDRLSGGTLWLELKREAEGEARGVPKALDLVAYNSETGSDAIPVAFLSGSQRFRVAVSLALAIGRFASQGGRRIESVIIDEGFGSLDREGRREMIDELHALKSALDRIILVSHQEEFASAFANKYVVELVDGSSRARLAVDD